jgi:ribosome-associated translation inhibitor RaiA
MPKTETMNLQLQLRGMRNCGELALLIEERLNALRRLIPISTARVVLEQQHHTTPSYRVFAHLAVPGPDIHAVAHDHTLLAAWRKLAENLAKQFLRRATRQQLRLRSRGQCRTVAGQWNRGG